MKVSNFTWKYIGKNIYTPSNLESIVCQNRNKNVNYELIKTHCSTWTNWRSKLKCIGSPISWNFPNYSAVWISGVTFTSTVRILLLYMKLHVLWGGTGVLYVTQKLNTLTTWLLKLFRRTLKEVGGKYGKVISQINLRCVNCLKSVYIIFERRLINLSSPSFPPLRKPHSVLMLIK